MALSKRFWAILFAALALIAIVLLSAGLTDMELRPGQAFRLPAGLDDGSERVFGPSDSALLGVLRTLWRAALALCLILLPFAILYFLISPHARKRIVREVLRVLSFLILFYFIAFGFSQRLQPASADIPLGASEWVGDAPLEFVPPSDAISYTVSAGLIAIAAIAGWLLWRRLHPPADPLQRLARQAQSALDELRAGGDFKNTVIRCYYEMSRTLNRQHGIQRMSDMTPREFEQRLMSAGLPARHVRRLTRLFEEARYSPKTPDAHEEREAIECLTAIVGALGPVA